MTFAATSTPIAWPQPLLGSMVTPPQRTFRAFARLLSDESFFVREAAAWPLTELAGTDNLAELLGAYQRGLDDGHDNDGFTAALIGLAESDPVHVAKALQPLSRSPDEALRENAQWLLTFCAPKQDA